MSLGAGFAAGIGAGIAIGMSSGQRRGQSQVCEYLKTNGIALFDQDGNRVSIEEIEENAQSALSCSTNNKLAILLGIAALAAIVLALVSRMGDHGAALGVQDPLQRRGSERNG